MAFLNPGVALAQAAPTPPPGALPSREQVLPPVPRSEAQSSEVRVDSRKAFREVACPFENSTAQVAIGQVQFTGINGAPLAPELANLLSGLRAQGGPQSVVQVCDIRDEANRILIDAGYVASVQIPPQNIDNGGALTLTVVSAKLVDVKVVGEAGGRYTKLIAARVERLKNIDPFNEREAERVLLLAGDVPGLDVQLTLAPSGTGIGEVAGTLTVAYRPYAIVGNVQNYSSKAIGRETAFVRAEAYGVTGMADITYVGGSATLDFEEQRVLQVGHSMGIDDEGTRLEGSFTYAWSRPDIGGLDLRSRSLAVTLAASSPLLRTVNENVTVTGGLDFTEQRTRLHFGRVLPLTRDKIRVLFGRLSGNLVRPSVTGFGYALSGGIEIRKGLDILGATDRFDFDSYEGGYTPSSLYGNPNALVARADLDGQIGLGSIFSLAGAARAQVSNAPLLNYEKFSIGTLTIGRGYDPGLASADEAIGLRAELRGATYRDANVATEVFTFYDQAWLWNHDRFARNGALATEPDRSFGSVGFGMRASLPQGLFLEGTYARPLDRAFPGDTRPVGDRLLLSLTAQFSPAAR
ncbi:ShlB/FhaC/HecB family hemolysin secretion/activation protein [Allosphingosinicella vermicomposti]|uniref:ShlB/FhaC/HecB family hemolysin secretion/activation protein n=1 Tax=Allosphingosinicella vermicomposti TaxID=614671 RepID=UPI00131A499A|nr:ShlB/FhaC/HecB family hemolysin secretion/activation protein [Allosphingosinicella vermicomposti]